MQFYRARSCGSVVAIEVIVEKTLDLCRFGKATPSETCLWSGHADESFL